MKASAWILSLVFAATVLGGCGKSGDGTTPTSTSMDKGSTTKTDSGMVVSSDANADKGMVKDAVYVNKDGKAMCPVLHTVIDDPKKAYASQTYNGVTYYFCCGGCPDQFKKDPKKYAIK